MDLVLTLITAPNSGALTHDMINEATAALTQAGARVGDTSWLAQNEACDIAFENITLEEAEKALGNCVFSADKVVQKAAGRAKKLLIADMDSTMVTGETLDELADFAGVKDRVAAITARAMNGELDFEEAIDERVGLLAGMSTAMLDEAWKRIEYTGGARVLVATMRANGAYAALVSGGFDFFTSAVRQDLGFDFDQANVLLTNDDNTLTGKVQKPVLDRQAKVDALEMLAAQNGITARDAIAVGDGANDLQMISIAGTGVAFHAKPSVQKQARIRINHGDLTALLYLQGYARDQFVGG
ncbi:MULTISPECIES: phosphoserine phosphatase SerB [unclassified Thalassospira]|uniref:phosphoserine phosphatase SerB n=1 Tax=unclassified Thalassospira TaxID=2648997 RepID=UPI000A1EE9A8|nr:phosphoserine phosphatase SerB [Thalassospira sp. MCCC 1A01428]OSQ42595.1 phosphoserine phosphatase [Thalassospira sp. MCCC 1A01428]